MVGSVSSRPYPTEEEKAKDAPVPEMTRPCLLIKSLIGLASVMYDYFLSVCKVLS